MSPAKTGPPGDTAQKVSFVNMTDRYAWHQIRERGTTLGMRLLLLSYSLGGRIVFSALLFPVIVFHFIIRRSARRASREYLTTLKHYFDISTPVTLVETFRHFWHFGQTLLDKFSVWQGKITRADVTVHGGDIIADLLKRGQGATILISHLGNFEVCQALSQDHPDLKMTVLMHSPHTAKFNRLLQKFNSGAAIELQEVGDMNISTAMRLSDKVSNGSFVAVSGDRTPITSANAVIEHHFLGRLACFPRGTFALARALQAPILNLHCIKQNGRYHIYFEQLSDGNPVPKHLRQQAEAALVEQYVDSLERFCQKTPLQWFNFYPFWTNTSQH